MLAAIKAIDYHLPEKVLTNTHLADEFPGWTQEKIERKIGITARNVVEDDECSSDLAVAAAEKLFASGACQRKDIDFVVLCTQSPDYFLPTTACLIQHRLGLPTSCGALDFNLGCSGFVYGLGMVKGLIETGQASRVLLLTSETYSKFLHPSDRGCRTIFGDAAAATLIEAVPEQGNGQAPHIGPCVFGTDGKGGELLIVRAGAMRNRQPTGGPVVKADDGTEYDPSGYLYMDGPEIFAFTLVSVPPLVDALLTRNQMSIDDVDLFVFHQANQFMLDRLCTRMGLPEDRFFIGMHDCGNTVSSTIPIALNQALEAGRLKSGDRVALVGFGVGLSWAATMLRWL